MPRKDYADCTEKYQGQVKLKSDGTIDNYVCGQPFSDASLVPGDPQSGFKKQSGISSIAGRITARSI